MYHVDMSISQMRHCNIAPIDMYVFMYCMYVHMCVYVCMYVCMSTLLNDVHQSTGSISIGKVVWF